MPIAQLMTVQALHSRLDEPNVVIVDCRFALDNPSYGQSSYQAGHIPGAYFADLEQDLSGPVHKGKTGRHPLPNPEALLETFRSFGIHSDTTVVLYDDGNAAFAARAWWLLLWLGKQDHLYLLDGGYKAWTQAGLPTTQDLPQAAQGSLSGVPHDQLTIEAEALHQQLTELTLLDARALARFLGEQEPIDPVAGHIPGAYCLPCTENIDARGQFLPPDQIRARAQQLLPLSTLEPSKVVAYCGSGVTACQNLFALCLAGYPLFKLYPGSWSEWITNPQHPLATSETLL